MFNEKNTQCPNCHLIVAPITRGVGDEDDFSYEVICPECGDIISED